jgi:hypothetical protein
MAPTDGKGMTSPRCTRCEGPLVMISLTLRDIDLTMKSCAKCGQRSWHRDGAVIDLDEVAKVVRTRQSA